MTFWEHLDELRGSLIRMAIAAIAMGLVAFAMKETLFDIVLAPSKSDFFLYRIIGAEPFDIKLINTGLAEQFTITYIGSLFEWQQPALEIVKQAIDEVNKSLITNKQSPVLLDLHTPHSNPIPHNQLGDAIRRSSIMLVLTSPHTHGMLTTKFYEALGCAKPVLCVPSDKGSLAELIQYTHAGIATDDKEVIKSFITARYNEWTQNGFTTQDTKHRESFTRENQYDQFYSTYLQC